MIYVSTKMYKPGNFMKVLRILDDIDGEVGIELFAKVESTDFIKAIEENLETLKQYPLTFHEPTAKIEHSAPKGSAVYEKTKEAFLQAIDLANKLNPKFMVFHLNNKEVENKEEMIKNMEENLREASSLSKVPLVIENVGNDSKDTLVLNEEEFIDFCQRQEEGVLIDIGHAQSNGWDLDNVIESLKDKIVAYQLHSSEGEKDLHERAFSEENTGYMMVFLELYKKYTPEADLILEYNSEYEDREGTLMLDVLRLKSILKI